MFPRYQIDKPRKKTSQVLEPLDPPEQKICISPTQEEKKGEDWVESWMMPPIKRLTPSGHILRTAVPTSHWEVSDDEEDRGVLRSSHYHQEFGESSSTSESTAPSKSKVGQSTHKAPVELGAAPVKYGQNIHPDKSRKHRSANKAPVQVKFGQTHTDKSGKHRSAPKAPAESTSRIDTNEEDPELGGSHFKSKSTSEKAHFGSKSISSDEDSKSVSTYEKIFQDYKKDKANTRRDPSELGFGLSSEASSLEDSSSEKESGSDEEFLDEYQEEGVFTPSYASLLILVFVNSAIASLIGIFLYAAAKNNENDASDNIFRGT
jgi:hypothetical protein